MTDQTTPVVTEDEDPAAAAARMAADVTPEEVEAAEEARAADDAQSPEARRAAMERLNNLKRAQNHLAPLPPSNGATQTSGVVVAPEAADLDLDEVNSIKVKLGGRVWTAVEPSIATNKILAATIRSSDDDEGDEGASAQRTLDSIYEQLQHILFDAETGRPPSREFVEQHLTGRNFGRLMERLNSTERSGNSRRA